MLFRSGKSSTTPGLIHGFGFSGAGFQIGPAAGEVLAELARDGRSRTPLAAFAVDRFRSASSLLTNQDVPFPVPLHP